MIARKSYVLDTRANDKAVNDKIDTDDESNWTEVSDSEEEKENVYQKSSIMKNPGQKRQLALQLEPSLNLTQNKMDLDPSESDFESDEDYYEVSDQKPSQHKRQKLPILPLMPSLQQQSKPTNEAEPNVFAHNKKDLDPLESDFESDGDYYEVSDPKPNQYKRQKLPAPSSLQQQSKPTNEAEPNDNKKNLDPLDSDFESDGDYYEDYYRKPEKAGRRGRRGRRSMPRPPQPQLQIRPRKSEQFTCTHDGCDFTTFQRFKLKEHALRHLETPPFECSLCEFASYARNSALRHIQTRHKKAKGDSYKWLRINEQLQVEDCSILNQCLFPTVLPMLPEIPKRHRCRVVGCDQQFVALKELQLHEKDAHRIVRPYRCIWDGCWGYSSNLRQHVARHIRSHHFGISNGQYIKAKKLGQVLDPRNVNDYIDTDADVFIA